MRNAGGAFGINARLSAASGAPRTSRPVRKRFIQSDLAPGLAGHGAAGPGIAGRSRAGIERAAFV